MSFLKDGDAATQQQQTEKSADGSYDSRNGVRYTDAFFYTLILPKKIGLGNKCLIFIVNFMICFWLYIYWSYFISLDIMILVSLICNDIITLIILQYCLLIHQVHQDESRRSAYRLGGSVRQYTVSQIWCIFVQIICEFCSYFRLLLVVST